MTASPLPELTIASLREAERLLARPEAIGYRHVLSLGSPGQPMPAGLEAHPARCLRLEFDDVRWHDGDHDDDQRAPVAHDVARIVEFARGIGIGEPTLIHCSMGFSRSAAAALIVLAVRLGAGREAVAVRELYRIKPIIFPNARMIRLADSMLGRGGTLFGALTGDHG